MDATQRLLAEIRTGQAPKQTKLAAAQGLIPLDGDTLPRVLYFLSFDADEDVRAAARESFGEVPAGMLLAVATRETTPADFLDFLARERTADEQLVTRIAQNRSISDATLRFIAHGAGPAVIDLLAANQARLLRDPRIIEALLGNPQTPRVVRLTLEDFRRQFADRIRTRLEEIEEEQRPPPPTHEVPASLSRQPAPHLERHDWVEDLLGGLETKTVSTGAPRRPGTAAGAVDLEAEEDVDLEAEEETEEGEEGYEDDGEPAAATPAELDLRERLRKLPISVKMLRAKMGSKQERSLLVKDSNKKVAVAAIQSPLITEFEVELVAKDRAISEEVLREIALSREWGKSYSILLALTHNPKTPMGVSLRLLQRLNDPDLKDLTVDRDVPYGLRASAQRIFDMRLRRRGQK